MRMILNINNEYLVLTGSGPPKSSMIDDLAARTVEIS